MQTREELEAAIVAAQARVWDALTGDVGAEAGAQETATAAVDDAERALGALWRQLGTEFGVEVVVPLEPGFEPAPDVSGATLLQDEYDAYLLFNTSTRRSGADGVAVIRLRACISTKFGLPNDEALDGHPLYGRGLEAYRCGEVLNSSWLAEEQRRNAVRFPAFKLTARHFVFTFHDSMLEVLAHDIEARVHVPGDHAALARECLARMYG